MNNRLNDVLEKKNENYILPFFWQHGEEEVVLRKYMNVIHDANIGAVCVESRPHPDFCGEKWWTDMNVILEEASRLNMKVWILDDSHFPTGYATGAVEKASKELCHQYLDYQVLSICGPMKEAQINIDEFAHPEKLPPFMPQPPEPKRVFQDDQLFKVIACPVEKNNCLGQPMDLTEFIQNEKLYWDVPEGYWKIYIIYLTRDGKGRNDYINFLDKESCRLLLDAVYETHYSHYKEYFGNVIAGFFSDEPPIGNTPGYTAGDLIGKPVQSLPWSSAVPKELETEFGDSDWSLYLPLLWANGSDEQMKARIRVAYMDVVSKLVESCFSNQIGEWCQEKGVEYIGHMLEDCDMNANMGPSMGHFFRGLAGQHMSGIDNIGGQVMIGGQDVERYPGMSCQDDAGFYHYELGKLGASLAAIDPKKKGRCMCENFGAYGWQCGVTMQKYLMDHFLVRGVNHYVPHAFSPAPFPDFDCPPHFYAHGQNPQYRAFGELMAYSNRMCHLLNGGVSETDIAVLYHGESQWSGEYQSNLFVTRELTQNQIDFHIIPSDVFEFRDKFNTEFDGKTLVVNKNKYKALIISACEFLYKPAAEFVVQALVANYPVIFIDKLPKGISNTDKATNQIIMKKIEECQIVPLKQLKGKLKELSVGDIKLDHEFQNMTVYHYVSDTNTYFFLNEDSAESWKGAITVNSKGNAVIYDAWENCLRSVSAESCEEGTKLNVNLAPLEMLIVVFLPEAPDALKPVLKAEGKLTILNDFTVSKAEALEYPNFNGKEEISILKSMSNLYPDFSGYYCYETTIDLSKSSQMIVEIDDAYEAAELFVNGHSVGTKVTKPYIYDIADVVQDGKNEIKIEVATTLERKVHSMGVDIYCMGKKAPLKPTGIVGQVRIYSKS